MGIEVYLIQMFWLKDNADLQQHAAPRGQKRNVPFLVMFTRVIYNWEDDLSSISLDDMSMTPAELCCRNCDRICSGENKRVQWPGCKAFTSYLRNPNSNYCQCWGYESKPDFECDERDEPAYLSGWCEEQTS